MPGVDDEPQFLAMGAGRLHVEVQAPAATVPAGLFYVSDEGDRKRVVGPRVRHENTKRTVTVRILLRAAVDEELNSALVLEMLLYAAHEP